MGWQINGRVSQELWYGSLLTLISDRSYGQYPQNSVNEGYSQNTTGSYIQHLAINRLNQAQVPYSSSTYVGQTRPPGAAQPWASGPTEIANAQRTLALPEQMRGSSKNSWGYTTPAINIHGQNSIYDPVPSHSPGSAVSPQSQGYNPDPKPGDGYLRSHQGTTVSPERMMGFNAAAQRHIDPPINTYGHSPIPYQDLNRSFTPVVCPQSHEYNQGPPQVNGYPHGHHKMPMLPEQARGFNTTVRGHAVPPISGYGYSPTYDQDPNHSPSPVVYPQSSGYNPGQPEGNEYSHNRQGTLVFQEQMTGHHATPWNYSISPNETYSYSPVYDRKSPHWDDNHGYLMESAQVCITLTNRHKSYTQ